AVAPADVEAVAARLRLPLVGGSRRRPDGRVVTWRTVGLGIALEDPSRPFFIDWQTAAADHPGRSPANHRSPSPTGLRLELSGDERAVRSWLGDEEAAIVVRPGAPAITGLVIETVTGAVVLEAADLR
ncbi:MAG TPA: VOC family protein, partial [Candidatus Limnocylindrales bacterium]|nr:VOC family protein [Candidatus Limnocylindrales bacterium]